jgi:hypothetical protein
MTSDTPTEEESGVLCSPLKDLEDEDDDEDD